MAKRIVSLPLSPLSEGEEKLSEGEEKTILIEVDEPAAKGIKPAAGIGKRERKSITEALDEIKPLALVIVSQLQELPIKEKEVKFGLKFTAQGNVLVANVGGEFNFEITLKW